MCPNRQAEVIGTFVFRLRQSGGETRIGHASHATAPLLHHIQLLKEACDDAITRLGNALFHVFDRHTGREQTRIFLLGNVWGVTLSEYNRIYLNIINEI